jgi:hypothetical protein
MFLFDRFVSAFVLMNVVSERIAIARALLRNPKVLLLDEVSAQCTQLYSFSLDGTRSRPHQPSTPTPRGSYRMHWTEPQREGLRSLSLTGYLQFKTQIRCKSTSLSH